MGGGDKQAKSDAHQASALELQIAAEQNERSRNLYNLGLPGFEKALKYYDDLSSGDPDILFRAAAPAVAGITSQTEAAKENIIESAPRGGEQRLATELADVGKSSQIGNLIAKSYLSAFPALASLAQGGIGFSINEIAQAIAGGSAAGNISTNIMQADAASKGATMGFLGSLAQAGGTVAAKAIPCWIAEVLWGKTDPRTRYLRFWLSHVWAKESVVGRVVVWLYSLLGRPVADMVYRYRPLRDLVEPVFQFGLNRAAMQMGVLR